MSLTQHDPACASPADRGSSTWRSRTWRKAGRLHCSEDWEFHKVTIKLEVDYIQTNRVQPIHRLSAVRSTLGVRWSHGNLQPLRHPGLPALLQVIGLEANGGRLTTRRCRRRTNRAATTQASPSERMLLRLRRLMTRLDPKRAAAVARCPTVQPEA